MTTYSIDMQQARDTAADWTSNDPTLAAGVIGWESDTGKLKIGDGATAWTSLDYYTAVSDVVTSVTGTLTTIAHSGNILVTSGNVTVPTTAGFNAVLVAGGAHTVTFNSTTSAAMAAGDVMTLFVESGTVIHAVLTASADKVSFT